MPVAIPGPLHRLARGIILAGSGFLLSVLWFDLKFDVLAWPAMLSGDEVSAEFLAAIRAYYLQVTGAESGGPPLIMTMMVLAILGSGVQAFNAGLPRWLRFACPVLLVPPIVLAAIRIVPNARILGQGDLDLTAQSDLAVLILQDHLFCITSIATVLLLQLWAGWRYP